MSDAVNEAVTALSDRIGSFDGSVKFVMEGEGAIMIDEAGVRAEDGDADCTLTASPETFKAILDGSLNATAAYMTGKLALDGDMGTAMRLGTML